MFSDSDEELDAMIRRAVSGKKGEDKGGWNCASCTFANHKDLLECEICSKTRQLTKSESGDLKTKLGVDKNSNSKKMGVKLTNGSDENAPSRDRKAMASAKYAELKQKNGPPKIRPVAKFVPRPTPPRAPSPPPPDPSYKLDDVFTTSEEPPRPSLLSNVPSTSSASTSSSISESLAKRKRLAAAKRTGSGTKPKTKPAAVDLVVASNPMNNPLDDLLVPLGPAKKQKLSSAAGTSSSFSSSSSKPDSAPFQKEAEKHRDQVQAKRANTDISKLENKPNLMLKSQADKNAQREDPEDVPLRKKPGAHVKPGSKSKSSSLITSRQAASTSRSYSNSPTPPPVDHVRKLPTPSPIPDYAQSVVPTPFTASTSKSKPTISAPPSDSHLHSRYAPDISGSERLNIWSIVYPMLKWNPSWLKEAMKANEPPPVVDRPQPIEHLKPFYEFFCEYHEIMHSPILFEMWESVLRDFREREQNRNNNKLFDRKLVMTGVETIADDERLWKINCEYLCEDSPFVVIPQEGDFVQVEVPTLQHESATHPSFAWVDTMEKIRIRKEMHVHPMLESMYGKSVWVGGKQTGLNVKLGIIIHKYLDTSVDVFKPLPCRILSSLISSIRQYQGLVVSPRSVLLPHILKPHDPEVFLPSLPPTPFKTTATDSSYNPSQTKAIQVSVNVMFQSTSAPKILLLQGPPGTGKSHTVLGIIATFFENCVVKPGAPKPRLLVCAPSNAGVDEIMRRLIALKKSSTNSRISSLNLVRCGMNSSVHPDVEEITLDNLIRAGKEPKKEGSLGPSQADSWVLEELKIRGENLKSEMEKLKKQRREYKGVKGKESELKEAEDKLRKAMDEEQDIAFQRNEIGRKEKAVDARTVKKSGVRNDFRNEAMRRIHTLEQAHVVGCTLNSSGSSMMDQAFGASVGKTGKRPQAFSCVIIDEACQAVELDCLIPLQHGVSKVIAVGDPEQLPCTVLSKKSQELDFGCSLFERLYKLFQTESRMLFRSDSYANFNPVLLLDTQYRMHPEICAFPSRHVYEGRVKTDSSVVERLSTRKCPYRPLLFFDLVDSKEISDGKGSAGGPSVSNLVEAVFTVALCLEIVKRFPPTSIGVITPYNRQKALIQGRMRNATYRDEEGVMRPLAGLVEVGTVDGFQGREKEFIILSCVRAQSDSGSIGFLSNKQRMNVALTRAKNGCFILGHARSLVKNRDWGALITDVQGRNSLTTVHANASPEVAAQFILKEHILPPSAIGGERGGGGEGGRGGYLGPNNHMPPMMPPRDQGGRKPKSKFEALRNQPSNQGPANQGFDPRGRPHHQPPHMPINGTGGFHSRSWYANEQNRPNPHQHPANHLQHPTHHPQHPPHPRHPHQPHQQPPQQHHPNHREPEPPSHSKHNLPPQLDKPKKPLRMTDLLEADGSVKSPPRDEGNASGKLKGNSSSSDSFFPPPSSSKSKEKSSSKGKLPSKQSRDKAGKHSSPSASDSVSKPSTSSSSSSVFTAESTLFPSLLNLPESPLTSDKKTDGESTTEEESPQTIANRINEQLRMGFSNWDDEDEDNGPEGGGGDARGEIIDEPPASPGKGPSLEIRRLSEAEDGEIMSEDEDEGHRPMVIPMEPEFTDDEDEMETNDKGENMDVDMRVGIQPQAGSDRGDTTPNPTRSSSASNLKAAPKRSISPVRFPDSMQL